jgi:hypothetical protein
MVAPLFSAHVDLHLKEKLSSIGAIEDERALRNRGWHHDAQWMPWQSTFARCYLILDISLDFSFSFILFL